MPEKMHAPDILATYDDIQVIEPVWKHRNRVRVFTTTRAGGFSGDPYASLNLGLHVDDKVEHVRANRRHLLTTLKAPTEPVWLNQTHGTAVWQSDLPAPDNRNTSFDASYTADAGKALCILTADCLPAVFVNSDASECAVAHAGWKGLADGILARTLAAFEAPPADLSVWLGPAIGANCFEVGDDVRQRFLRGWGGHCAEAVNRCFVPKTEPGKWLANLYLLAELSLRHCGVENITGGQHCTFTDRQHFFSYRRDGASSGRMGTFAWIL